MKTSVARSAVVMITAYGTPGTLSRAIALGAFRVVSKPVDAPDLLTLVLEAAASRDA